MKGVHKRAVKGFDEQDALTGWRRYLLWRPGEVAWIKRKARRRERQQAKREIRAENEGQQHG